MQQLNGPENENLNGELTQPETKDAADASVASANETQNVQRSESRKRVGRKERSSAVAHGATGPRTETGKRRSRFNALKSGIFSKEILLKNESAGQYAALLNSLQEDIQPVGKREDILVETIASNLWRKSRFLRVERAEIENAPKFRAINSLRAQQIDLWDSLRDGQHSIGLLRHSSNPLVLKEAKEILSLLRDQLLEYASREEMNEQLLKMAYGLENKGAVSFNIYYAYSRLVKLAEESWKKGKEHSIPDDFKEKVRAAFDAEIRHLELAEMFIRIQDKEREQYQAIAGLVPLQEVSDRLIRYEAHLSREFDRTLNQLERLQRIRRGQPLPPSIKIELQSSAGHGNSLPLLRGELGLR